MTSPMCFTKRYKSTIDLIFTNKESYFKKTKATETGLSDCNRLISTFLRSQFCRLKSKKIYYRNFKNFTEKNFLEEVKNTDFIFNSDNQNGNYDIIANIFFNTVEKHAPLKKKFSWGNQAPSISKKFCKATFSSSRLRNKVCKIPNEENENYARSKEISVSQSVRKVLEIISTKLLMGT